MIPAEGPASRRHAARPGRADEVGNGRDPAAIAAAAAEPGAAVEDLDPDEASEAGDDGYYEEEEGDDEAEGAMSPRERDLLDFVWVTTERDWMAWFDDGEYEHLDVDDKVRIAAFLAGANDIRQSTHPHGTPAEQQRERNLLVHLRDLGSSDDLRNSFRTYLTLVVVLGPDPPVRQVAESGAVPVFVEIFRSHGQHPAAHRLAAAGFLAVISAASSTKESTTPDYARLMNDLDLLPCLVGQLRSGNVSAALMPLLSVLACTPGDSPTYGAWALDTKALPELLKHLSESDHLDKIRTMAAQLHVFLGEGAGPSPKRVRAALRALRVFLGFSDAKVLAEACRALSVLTLGAGINGDDRRNGALADGRIQMVVTTPGVCRRLAELLGHPSPNVKSYVEPVQELWSWTPNGHAPDSSHSRFLPRCRPALLAVGNIVSSSQARVRSMLDHEALLLPNLAALLHPSHWKDFRENASAVLATLTAAGNARAMRAVVDSANVLPALLDRLLEDDVLDVRKNAARAIRNVTSRGTSSQINAWVGRGCIRPLCAALDLGDAEIVSAALEALECILRNGKEQERTRGSPAGGATAVDQVVQAGGTSKIQALLLRGDSSVRERSNRLLGTYFGTDEKAAVPSPLSVVVPDVRGQDGPDAASLGRSN